MVLCLLLGSILLIATVVSFPLYRNAAFDRMLVDEFQNSLSETGQWPAMLNMVTMSKKDKGGKNIKKMEDLVSQVYSELGVTEKVTVKYYLQEQKEAASTMQRSDSSDMRLRLGFLSALPTHAKMLSGQMYSDAGVDDQGNIEVVVSENTMVTANLLVGECVEFKGLKDVSGKAIKVKIVGVFEEEDRNDFYWQVKPDEMSGILLMNEQLFSDMFLGEAAGKYTLTCNFYTLFEYQNITATSVEKVATYSNWLKKESPYKATVKKVYYSDIIEQFSKKKDRIEATLFILQVPVLILLAAFLFMISGQMYDMERNEISVMKSRGGSSGQMFRLYLYQSILLTLIGGAVGVFLGTIFCRILGSAQNFLEFNMRRELNVTFTKDTWIYLLIVMVSSVAIMTLPALKHSRLTIVKLKQSNALRKRAWWEKLFLDVISIGVAIYGYRSFSKNQQVMVTNVLQGESLDPLLYFSSSLFIVGMGLLFLRLQPLAIKLIYTLGKKFWSPASYASFMENVKNGKKQQFIMLFMILTISLGMYHATVARTILQNAKENAEYLEPVDLIIKEQWADNSAMMSSSSSSGNMEKTYIEPDFGKYSKIAGASSITKVIYDAKASAAVGVKQYQPCTLMAIHTREFGEITALPAGLQEKAYREYLNALAVEPRGILVSEQFKNSYGFKVGDTMDYKDTDGNTVTGKIVEFVKYWPGYNPQTISMKSDGTAEMTENLLVIANISYLQQKFGVTPYEVWVDLEDNANSDGVYQWIADNDVHVKKFVDKQVELKKVTEDPLLQGTNGVLTMGFIVTIILCAVGYLIYWIMSIRSREMLFGVLRACGMHKGELFHLLINEQIFSGLLSILAGIGIGHLTSSMFVPILQTAYAAANQVLPMKLITDKGDLIRLYGVVGAVMALCLFILIMIVFKLNVTKALKLGEE